MKSDAGKLGIVPLAVLTDKSVPHGAVRLYALLYALWADRMDEIDPARPQLAAGLDVSMDTIDRWIQALLHTGALRFIPSTPDDPSPPAPVHYELHLVPHRGTDTAIETGEVRPSETPMHFDIEDGSPSPSRNDTAMVKTRERESKRGTSTKSTSKRTYGPRAVRFRARTYERFTQFYKLYPRKARRQDALRAWIKLGVEDDTDLWVKVMTGLRNVLGIWEQEGREQRFIPHPSRFLRGEEYLDTLVVTPTAPKLTPQNQQLKDASTRFLERHGESR